VDYDARVHQRPAPVQLVDEVVQHLLGDVEVGDHAILERPDRHDVAGRPSEHGLRVVAHGEHRVVGDVNGHDGRLVHHDALAADVHEGIGRAEVDGEVVGEQPGEETDQHAETAL